MKMQSFVYFLVILAMSLAAKVSVYTDNDSFTKRLTSTMPEHKPVSCFSFGYHLNNELHLHIYFINKPPTVTAIHLIFHSGKQIVERLKFDEFTGKKSDWVHQVHWVLMYHEVEISLEIYKSQTLCSTITVAEGMDVDTSNNNITEKTYRDNGICFNKSEPCVLLVNLEHDCEASSPHENKKTSTDCSANNTGDPVIAVRNVKTTTAKPNMVLESSSNSSFNSNVPTSPQNENIGTTTNGTESADRHPSFQNVLIYVITSVIVVCVIILVIYLCAKKYRNSHPIESLELNTYATLNEVVYADLSLMHGYSQSPRHEEESPYAEIIGVMKPVDGHSKNK